MSQSVNIPEAFKSLLNEFSSDLFRRHRVMTLFRCTLCPHKAAAEAMLVKMPLSGRGTKRCFQSKCAAIAQSDALGK